jgi:MtfA peptidase
VHFYRELAAADRARFEQDILTFWRDCAITGVNVEVDDADRLLVAASAVIPTFSFPGWRYTNLDEVVLYPAMFNERFETAGGDRAILGQVGSGVMSRKMLLSKPALHQGFQARNDGSNTGIHEFVHLIDARDGETDGLPKALMDRPYAIPWLRLVRQEMGRIQVGRSDIRPYGGVSETEFLPVVSEYFFERPEQLQRKHPELYTALERMFRPGEKERA